MKKNFIYASIALALLLGGCREKTAVPPAARTITVFAAASLKEVVLEIVTRWSKQTGHAVQLQFEASSTLARQIRHGAHADVFISAAPEWADELAPLERFNWLSNRLVCVTRKNAGAFDIHALDSLAIANEQVPAGAYAKAALASLNISLPNRTIYGSTVRDVLSKVSQGGATAGIVYATDACIDPTVEVAYAFPAQSHPQILYVACALTESGKPLCQALDEAWVLDIAYQYGFVDIE